MKDLDFPRRVNRTIRRYGMDVSRPLVMVSGGPDSVALLYAVVELGGRPVALHVDYGLRGEESRRDAEFVRELCGEVGLACEIKSFGLEGSGLQEEARRGRYRLAKEVAIELGISTILTGHTADDVAETVIMNLARGAGTRGISGIPPVRGRLARPLIERRREEVLHYLQDLNQPFRTDSTNLVPKYARNRVRLEILPVLEELYPGAGGNMARAADLLREDLAALEGIARGALRRRGGELYVPVGELREMPLALRRHIVREAYWALLPKAFPLGFGAVEAILALAVRSEGTRELHLPGGVSAVARSGEELAFYRARETAAPVEQALLPGVHEVEGWEIRVSEVLGFDTQEAARPEVVYLDASLGPYRVRTVREGDTIRPSGLGGTKKVFKALKDRKVPKDVRGRMPIVVDRRGEIAWVPLGELDEKHKVGGETEQAVRLEVLRSAWR